MSVEAFVHELIPHECSHVHTMGVMEGEVKLSHDGVVILDTNVEKIQNGVNAASDRPKDKSRIYRGKEESGVSESLEWV